MKKSKYKTAKSRTKYKVVKSKLKITARERRFMKLYAPTARQGAPTGDRPWLVVDQQYFPINVSLDPHEKESYEWYRWQLAKALIWLVDVEKGKI